MFVILFPTRPTPVGILAAATAGRTAPDVPAEENRKKPRSFTKNERNPTFTEMKEKIKRLIANLGQTVRHAPAETFLSLYSLLVLSLIREDAFGENEAYGLLLPVFFCFSRILNKLCRKGKIRILYYLSPLAAFPWIGTDVAAWADTANYSVTLAVCGLGLAACTLIRENKPFVERVLRYVYDLTAALLLALVTFLAVIAIFFSVVYIFDVFHSVEDDFAFYSMLAAFTVLFPICFLSFDSDSDDDPGLRTSAFFDILTNYVLTPAVIVYTAILYVYFATILLRWSLPKGGIAYLVFVYAIVALLVKAVQPLLNRQLYDWYYKRFSLIALPALGMFWVGAGYRIHQYGFTQERVYLLVCGAIMTLTVLMFLNRRTGRYFYATIAAAGLLALFTYVPGLTAESIGLRSQFRRTDRIATRLGLTDPSGRFVKTKRPDADTLFREDYRELYESFLYLGRKCGTDALEERYGIAGASVLRDKIVPAALESYIDYPYSPVVEDTEAKGLRLDAEDRPADISGYGRLYDVRHYEDGSHPHARFNNDTLVIRTSEGDTVLVAAAADILRSQLAGTGYRPGDSIVPSNDSLRAWRDRLLEYRTDSVKLIFEEVYLEKAPSLHIVHLTVGNMVMP